LAARPFDRSYVAPAATTFETECGECLARAREKGWYWHSEIEAAQMAGDMPLHEERLVARCAEGHPTELIRIGGTQFSRRAREGRIYFEHDATSVQLSILGYAHPDSDSNFLRVRLDALDRGREWTAVDPCLDTWDLARLADWLDREETRVARSKDMWFTGPALEFFWTDSGGLRVYVEQEFRPRWAPCSLDNERQVYLDFTPTTDELHAVAAALRAELLRFPPRLED
jgi:hypothetical protein